MEKYKRILPFIVLTGVILVTFFREPSFFLTPRFWAEDGKLYYATAYYYAHSSVWFRGLFQVQVGYFSLWPNMAATASANLVSLENAPLATTLFAAAVQLVPFVIILWSDSEFWRSPGRRLAGVLVLLFSLSSGEIWLTTIGSQFYLAICTFLLLLENAATSSVRRWVYRIIPLFAGLTGVASCILTPLFFIRAYREKNRERLIQAIILSACTGLQILLLSFSSSTSVSNRFLFDIPVYILSLWTQGMGQDLLGIQCNNILAEKFFALHEHGGVWFMAMVFSVAVLEGLILSLLLIKLDSKERFIFFSAFFLLTFVSVLGSLNTDKLTYVRPGIGERYAFVPNVVWLLLVLANINKPYCFRSCVAAVLLATSLFWGLFEYQSAFFKHSDWPKWKDEVRSWRENVEHKIIIWPAGWDVVLFQIGQQAEIERYEQDLLKSETAETHFKLGDLLFRARRLPEAIEHYQQTVRMDPSYPEAYMNLGNALVDADRLPEAVESLEQAAVLKPDLPKIHDRLGSVLCKLNRPEEALEHCEEALRLKPDFPQAHYNLATALSELGRASEAIEHYQQAIEMEPDFAAAHVDLGNVLDRLGRQLEAKEQYERALTINPRIHLSYKTLGVDLAQKGQSQQAIDYFEKALALKSDQADVHYNLGLAFFRTGRIREAVEHYERAVALKADYTEAYNNLGAALVQAGWPEEAIENFEKALQLKPNYPEAHNDLGIALMQTGMPQEAIEHFQQALRLKKDYIEASYNLGNAYKTLGKYQEAIENYENVLRLNPKRHEVHANLGAALFETGRLQEAIKHFEQALEIRPDYANAYSNLALAYAKMDQSDKAIAAAEKAIELARAQGQQAMAKQVEDWLNSYRSTPPDVPEAATSSESGPLP